MGEQTSDRENALRRGRLADRLGLSVHQSVLERRIRKLMQVYVLAASQRPEDWLMAVAHVRGAKVVMRPDGVDAAFVAPPQTLFPNEELVVAICALQRVDEPQCLRLAAQLVSRGAVSVRRLILLARRERADRVLGELARQALQVESDHLIWQQIAEAFPQRCALRSPVAHWQRLAWPVMSERRPNAERWVLVR